MLQSFERVIVQVHVGQLDLAHLQRIRVDHEPVVLHRDFYFPGGEVHHRVIAAVVAEFQLEGPAPQGQSENLVPETDSKDGHSPDQLSYVLGGVFERLGVSGAVREKYAVRLSGQHLRRRSGCGNHRHQATLFHQLAQDVLLDSKIIGDDTEPGLAATTREGGNRALIEIRTHGSVQS